MKVLILTADSNGGYPVPASKGSAVSTLMEQLAEGNNAQRLCDMEIMSFYDEKAFEMAKQYPHITFLWVKPTALHRLLDKCAFNFIRLLKKNEKAVSFKSPFSLLYYIRKAGKRLRVTDADKVILENNIPLARALRKTPFRGQWFYHFHNVPRIDGGCRDVFERTTGFLCVSQFVADRLSAPDSAIGAIPADKTAVFYNCVDTAQFQPMPRDSGELAALRKKLGVADGDRVMIFTGRLTAEKGAEHLLRALQLLPENYKAVIVGSYHYNADVKSDYQQQLYALAESLKDRVIFTGYVQHDELPLYYNLADVAVLPSMWDEPAGLTNLEAMACGVPVITTNSGGIPEYVGDSVVLERGERLGEEIAERVQALLADSEGYERACRYSRQFVRDRFDKDRYINRFIEALGVF